MLHRYSLTQRVAAVGFGTLMLLTTVIGSGIMAERLAGGNDAVALLATRSRQSAACTS
jgi:hypothetical protein